MASVRSKKSLNRDSGKKGLENGAGSACPAVPSGAGFQASIAEDDRRSESRNPALGSVLLRDGDLHQNQWHGDLIDISSRGFRATFSRHATATNPATVLSVGVAYRFEHFSLACFRLRSGYAKAVWTRVSGDLIEAGFYVQSIDHG